MKLGAAWYGFGDQTPSNYFEMVAALGLRYAEVPLYAMNQSTWYGSPAAVRTIREAAQETGVRIVTGVAALNIAGWIDGDQLVRDGVDVGMAQARRAIEIGAFLGTEIIRLAEPADLWRAPEALEEPYLAAYGEAFHTLGAYAAERGVRVAIENTGLTSTWIGRIIDLADHPAVGTLYDPCNYYRYGEDPLSALRNLGVQRVFYCHLKDAYFPYPARQPESLPVTGFSGQMEPWWWIRPLGEGNIDWGPILAELGTSYDGYLCLEHDIRDSVMRGTRVGMAHVHRVAEERGLTVEL